MADDDLIFALYPFHSEGDTHPGAFKVIYSDKNASYSRRGLGGLEKAEASAHESPGEEDVDEPYPGATPLPDSPGQYEHWLDGPRLQFFWGDHRKSRHGFLFGSAESMCDITIPEHATYFRGVSAVHGLVKFDEQMRLVYRDLRNPDVKGDGSAVLFDGRGGDKRRGFTWTLSGTDYLDTEAPLIILKLHDKLSFRVYIPPHSRTSSEYQQNVASFRLQQGQTDNLVGKLPVGLLSFDIDDTTAVPSGVHTMSQGSILIDTKEPLGYGGFGSVKRMYDVNRGIYIARKIPLEHLSERTRILWIREIRLLKRVSEAAASTAEARDFSSHIIRIIDGTLEPAPIIDLEYAPYGSLRSQHRSQRLSGDEILAVLEQTLKGLAFLHGLDPPVAHRDIKPANILVQYRDAYANGSIHIKLGDFGLSKDETLTSFHMGTDKYMAPELYGVRMPDWDGYRPRYTLTVDIWALGVTIFELAHKLRKKADDGESLCSRIMEHIRNTRGGLASFLSRHMVVWDPADRFSARSCLDLMRQELLTSPGLETPRQGSPVRNSSSDQNSDSQGTTAPLRTAMRRSACPSPSTPRGPDSEKKTSKRPLSSSLSSEQLVSHSRRRRTSSCSQHNPPRDASSAPRGSHSPSASHSDRSTESESGSSSQYEDEEYEDDDDQELAPPGSPNIRLHIHDVGGDPQATIAYGGSSGVRSEFSPLPSSGSGWPKWNDEEVNEWAHAQNSGGEK